MVRVCPLIHLSTIDGRDTSCLSLFREGDILRLYITKLILGSRVAPGRETRHEPPRGRPPAPPQPDNLLQTSVGSELILTMYGPDRCPGCHCQSILAQT